MTSAWSASSATSPGPRAPSWGGQVSRVLFFLLRASPHDTAQRRAVQSGFDPARLAPGIATAHMTGTPTCMRRPDFCARGVVQGTSGYFLPSHPIPPRSSGRDPVRHVPSPRPARRRRMNGSVRETAREPYRMGDIDVFTAAEPRSYASVMGHGRVIHLAAAAGPMPRETCTPTWATSWRAWSNSARQGLRVRPDPRVLLARVAGLALREKRDALLVQMFHTGRPARWRRRRGRARAADRRGVAITAGPTARAANVVERAHLVWYHGARRARRVIPACGHGAVPAMNARRAICSARPGRPGSTGAAADRVETLLDAMRAAGGHPAHHRRRPGRA